MTAFPLLQKNNL